jgi:hypothetical protein
VRSWRRREPGRAYLSKGSVCLLPFEHQQRFAPMCVGCGQIEARTHVSDRHVPHADRALAPGGCDLVCARAHLAWEAPLSNANHASAKSVVVGLTCSASSVDVISVSRGAEQVLDARNGLPKTRRGQDLSVPQHITTRTPKITDTQIASHPYQWLLA